MREYDYKKYCLHYLEHLCPSFQVMGAVTESYYLRDAEKNRISQPGLPGVVSNPVVGSLQHLYTRFYK